MKTMKKIWLVAFISVAVALWGCKERKEQPAYILETDHFNPGWFWVKDRSGKQILFYRDGELVVDSINTNRTTVATRWQTLPHTEKWKDHGAVAIFGHCWGGVVSREETNATVQYWLVSSFWDNVFVPSMRNVQPSDVVVWTAQEPIVTNTGKEWRITFRQ